MSSDVLPQTSAPLVDGEADATFYIPATGPSSRPRRTLKKDDTFMVLDSHGDVGATAGGPDGLFNCDTRFLSRLELLLDGMQPLLLGSNLRDDNSVLTVDLTNSDIYFDKRIVLRKDTLHVLRTTFLGQGAAYQRLALQNHGDISIAIELSLTFGNEFTDLFEVRGLRRKRRGVTKARILAANNVNYIYQGLDKAVRQTNIQFDPEPSRLSTSDAVYALQLEPGQRIALYLQIDCNRQEPCSGQNILRELVKTRRELRHESSGGARVVASNELLNEMLNRAVADLYMLTTATPQGPYPYAGTPWYSTTFGRDGIITAMQMLWLDPRIARGVLHRLAAYQAKDYDQAADAEPGKILHEMRGGEMSALREVPFGLYYGSVDSTPLFVLLAGLYWQRTGDDKTLRELWPNIEAALRWIDGPGDPDQDGFVEYHRLTDEGLSNQGWKDSHDSIFHENGKLAEGPIALAEVQGYVYAAKMIAAQCAEHLGLAPLADELMRAARTLAERFEQAFWCPEIETYALALDGHKNPCRVRSSNAGQLLFSKMIRPDRARLVADGMLEPRFYSGWGIRTIATGEARYNPMSYHNGSIWPHDNALIALGFHQYGFKDAADRIFKSLFDAASYMDLRRLPELFCGFKRGRGRGPTLYPVACTPQAWASGAFLQFIQASLGLEFHPHQNEIKLRNPSLPPFIQQLAISDLRLGKSSVDLCVRRNEGAVSLQVTRRVGTVQVSIELN